MPPTWIDPLFQMPPDGLVVIVEFAGMWPNHGNTGIRDAYAWNGQWYNIPEGVSITKWMFIPD